MLAFYKKYQFPDTSIEKTRTYIFPKLLKYLSNTHIFYYYDNGQKCNYLSYLLYDYIKTQEFDECKSSTFEIFQKFVQELHTIGINHACANKLEHLDPYKFKKMKSLYKLYDLYRSLKETEKLPLRPNLCRDLGTLIFYYNQFDANYYKDDPNLRKMLDELRHKIQKNTWMSNDNCSAKLEHLWPLKTFPPENVEQAQMNVKAFHLTQSPQKSTHIKSEIEDVEIRNPSVPELQGREEKLPKVVETLAIPERKIEEEEEEEEQQQQQQQDGKHLREINQPFPYTLLSFSPKETYQENEISLGSGYGTDTMQPLTKPNNSHGIVDKIQNALSDTFQNIEPAPILGVSGGMGALFLIFKVFIALKI
ncbi:hypothetical protein PVBG_05037 [Plasmodium vivax Brazil I]|uniref:VIR protein n=1 Tax=Plasmodium vivax (strain Brazil I) TaxID=1033975 RepID=A0A0J9SXI6_PLAV1|nr:hypothetical protein PVBG_05037 [Plasmodium vivax Brazil I]